MTASSCSIRARPAAPFGRASLIISTDRSLDGARIIEPTDTFDRVVDFRVSDLEPDVTYFYAVIADHIAAGSVGNLLMVSGDAHMVAIDDGTHTNDSSTPGTAFPLVHVAALDRPGSTKGGPYTQGPIAGGGHYAVVDVAARNDGAAIDVTVTASDWRGRELLRHRFSTELTAA